MKNISFKLIFRSWWRNKTFAVISILSLAVGIACTNLLAAFVIHEYNVEYDNPMKNRIVLFSQTYPEFNLTMVTNIAPETSNMLLSEIPELEETCNVYKHSNSDLCKVDEHEFTDFTVVESDSAFIRFFPYNAIMGSLDDAMSAPDRIVITESFAKRLFGKSNPIGQLLQIQYTPSGYPGERTGLQSYTIAAVVKDRDQTILSFDAIFFSKPTKGLNFFSLKEGISIPAVQDKIGSLDFSPSDQIYSLENKLHSMQEACISPDFPSLQVNKYNSTLLFIALFSAILILAIACFNYVNLSFSRVFKQLYSIHVQKLMGAGSRQLSIQLFADTFMTVGLGFLIAQLMQYDLLSVVNRIMSAQVPASFLYSNQVLPVTLGFVLILALIPAIYMSSRLPDMSISVYNNFYRGKARQRIISTLAIMQFVISFILIIGTFCVRQQISLLYDKTENYKNIYAFETTNTDKLPLLKEKIAHLPGIEAVSLSSGTLLQYTMTILRSTENGENITKTLAVESGDEGLMDVMGHRIIQGIPWEEVIEQYPNPIYLNRSYAQRLLPDGTFPAGSLFKDYEEGAKEAPMGEYIIAGVIEDFLRDDLETPVQESIIRFKRDGGLFLQVRTEPEHTAEVLSQMEAEWDIINPGELIKYRSMYDGVLAKNKKLFEMSDLLMMYSIISILLTCFGLFGMALYAIEQRTKEIGIRKVNGSTTWQIMKLLNRQFIIWIGIAYIIAVPVTWWLISRWMESFVYRADFSIWTYILPLVIVTVITLLTVCWNSYKAATGNPVEALRDE